MSSEALYEQYKDALKRGHVAALRGQVDAALLAYAEAARIAPERSTPHASAGTALLRRKRFAEALRHYQVALSIAPRDEAALLGRAQALGGLERRPEAADAYDVLAEVQAGAGRLADAVDAARRGLEVAEGRERRRTLERLIVRLRASEPGEPGRLALERALRVLDGVAVPSKPSAPLRESPAASDMLPLVEPGPDAAPATPTQESADAVEQPSELAPVPGGGAVPDEAPVDATGEPAEPVEADAAPAASGPEAMEVVALEAPPEPVAAAEPEPPGTAVAELVARAEAAAAAGVPGPAVEAALDLATAHARDGRIEAALDACYTALSFDPDHVGLHLALVEIYAGRGWSTLAAEKLDLLDRLARLDGDEGAATAVAGARAALR